MLAIAWAGAQALLIAAVAWTWHRWGPVDERLTAGLVTWLGPSLVDVRKLAWGGYCEHRLACALRAAGWKPGSRQLLAPAWGVEIKLAEEDAGTQDVGRAQLDARIARLLSRVSAMNEPERRFEAATEPWFAVGGDGDTPGWAVWREHRPSQSRLWLGVGRDLVAVTVRHEDRTWRVDVSAPQTRAVGRLASGQLVVASEESHLHAGAVVLLPEVLGRIRREPPNRVAATVDLHRVVGVTTCVATTDADEVFYAQRPGRAGLTRFVAGRESEPASEATVVLEQVPSGDEHVVSAWIGGAHPPEPWDPRATVESRDFWSRHALVAGSEPIVAGSETDERPW